MTLGVLRDDGPVEWNPWASRLSSRLQGRNSPEEPSPHVDQRSSPIPRRRAEPLCTAAGGHGAPVAAVRSDADAILSRRRTLALVGDLPRSDGDLHRGGL